jgi:hypothetical protein
MPLAAPAGVDSRLLAGCPGLGLCPTAHAPQIVGEWRPQWWRVLITSLAPFLMNGKARIEILPPSPPLVRRRFVVHVAPLALLLSPGQRSRVDRPARPLRGATAGDQHPVDTFPPSRLCNVSYRHTSVTIRYVTNSGSAHVRASSAASSRSTSRQSRAMKATPPKRRTRERNSA